MLDVLRKSSGSWVVKILFVLLIISFGVWGVGDVVRGLATDRVAIKVGDLEYDPAYVGKQFSRQVEQFRGMFGPNFNAESAKQLGLLDNTVAQIVSTATQEMAAKDLGLVVSEDGLKQAILDQPYFKGADGTFDRNLFDRTLMSNNLNEEQYLALIRPELVVQRVTSAVEGNAVAPKVLAETLYRYQHEIRTGEALMVVAAAQPLDKQASEDDLKAVYDANAARFMAPETRSLSVILLRSEDMAGRLDVSDQEIADHYAANGDQYTTPETREVVQVLLETEDAAKAVAAAATAPDALETAATANKGVYLPMGKISRDGLPAEAAEAVMALQPGQVSAPVQSPLGWHVFGVTGIQPAAKKSLEDVRDSIRQELLRAKAEDAIYQVARQTEDTLASGIGFAETAKQLSLPLIEIAGVTEKGLDDAGNPAGDLPDAMKEQILASAFALQSGEESRVEQTEAGQFILRVDAVTPASQRPLDAVRNEVVRLWEASARKTKAEAVSKTLEEQVKAGKALSELADPAKGISLASIAAVTRDGRNAAGEPVLSKPVAQRLFSLAVNDSTAVTTESGAAVIRLQSVIAADPAKDKAGVDAIATSLTQASGADLMEAATAAFGTRFKIVVKRELIDKVL